MTDLKIKPIRNDEDHRRSLEMVDRLWGAEPNTEAGETLDILLVLIEAYEEKNHPILPPNPVDAIRFRLEQLGAGQAVLAEIVGPNRASEILGHKRKLSISQIRDINAELKIPVEALIVDYELRKDPNSHTNQ